jgi:hypothetical protein
MKKALGMRSAEQLSEYGDDVLLKVVSSAGGARADNASAGCCSLLTDQPLASLCLAYCVEQQDVSLSQQNNRHIAVTTT